MRPRDGYFDFFSRELYCLLQDADEAELQRLGLQARGDAALPAPLRTGHLQRR